jgi:ABC-type transport system involved in multi-copper enzyme maturation permease subunit
MKKQNKILMVIGILLIINGIGNIIDDSRVLVYDITSILSGIGFIVISKKFKS